jgi:hypothetical protein
VNIKFIEMGIYYGDVHYGIRISKKVVIDGDTFLEHIYSDSRSTKRSESANIPKFTEEYYELIFDESREDVLKKVADMYYKLSEPSEYRYELLVDVYTTYDGPQNNKGWQVITVEQMTEFIGGMYKISRGTAAHL